MSEPFIWCIIVFPVSTFPLFDSKFYKRWSTVNLAASVYVCMCVLQAPSCKSCLIIMIIDVLCSIIAIGGRDLAFWASPECRPQTTVQKPRTRPNLPHTPFPSFPPILPPSQFCKQTISGPSRCCFYTSMCLIDLIV